MTIPLGSKPPSHTRLTFEGIFGAILAPVEEWSFRLNLVNAATADQRAAALPAMVTAFSTHLAPRIRPVARLVRVKIAEITEAGLYSDSGAQFLDTDVAGASTVNTPMPLQITVVQTLLTATRGPRGRGRLFLPAPQVGVLSNEGLMGSTTAQAFASSTAAFLSAINANTALGQVVVASSSGFLRPVTGVKVGVVPDTMRSRREKVSEAYGATLAVTNA